MSAKFTKKLRQEIVDDFSRRHNGQYDPKLFLKEVKETGPDHPAHSWFEWDESKAANEFLLWQARSFAKDLRIKFAVEEVGRSGTVSVKTVEAPMVISPSAERKKGGGYVVVDPNNPEHQAEHCRQAATALRCWMERYQAALMFAGIPTGSFDLTIRALENPSVPDPKKIENPALVLETA